MAGKCPLVLCCPKLVLGSATSASPGSQLEVHPPSPHPPPHTPGESNLHFNWVPRGLMHNKVGTRTASLELFSGSLRATTSYWVSTFSNSTHKSIHPSFLRCQSSMLPGLLAPTCHPLLFSRLFRLPFILPIIPKQWDKISNT